MCSTLVFLKKSIKSYIYVYVYMHINKGERENKVVNISCWLPQGESHWEEIMGE